MASNDKELLQAASEYLGMQIAVIYLEQLKVPYSRDFDPEPPRIPLNNRQRTVISRRHVLAIGSGAVLGGLLGKGLASATETGSALDEPNAVIAPIGGGVLGAAGTAGAVSLHRTRVRNRIIEKQFFAALDAASGATSHLPLEDVNAGMIAQLNKWSREKAPLLNEIAEYHRDAGLFMPAYQPNTPTEYVAASVCRAVVDNAGRLDHGIG